MIREGGKQSMLSMLEERGYVDTIAGYCPVCALHLRPRFLLIVARIGIVMRLINS